MNKNTIRVGLLSLGLIGATSSQAAPVVVDDFNTLGQTFITDYTYVTEPFSNASNQPNNLWPAGTLAEVFNATQVHGLWSSVTSAPADPAAPAVDRFLAVNGSLVGGQKVFERTGIAVTPGLTYFFDSWLTAVFPGISAPATADLQFSIQFLNGAAVPIGAPILGPVTSPIVPNVWVLNSLSGLAPAGAATATITLRNSEATFTGNDFGVDYITFDTERQTPVPELSTGISAGAFALVGGLIVLRRRKAAQVA